jgi:D-arabinose 5-phosphate isomerase GutQ
MSDCDPLRRARAIIAGTCRGLQQLSEQLDENLLQVVELLYACQGHVLVTGAGTSRAVAERFAHLLSCCGTPALFIHAADCLHGASGAIRPQDVVYIISKGGHSAEINQFAAIARQRGARLIAHTERLDSPLAQLCDARLHVVAPADIDPFGMIATGSSLVNCAATNVICELLLEKRGYSQESFSQTHPGGAVGKKIAGLLA